MVKSTVSEVAPVQYKMRVRCDLLKASWTMKPHRYSAFETLQTKLEALDDADWLKTAELPPKHLIFPTRAALVQRSVGLQRYCCALLSHPAALRSKDVG